MSDANIMRRELVTAKEAAGILGVSLSVVYKLTDEEIKPYLNKPLLFLGEDILRLAKKFKPTKGGRQRRRVRTGVSGTG